MPTSNLDVLPPLHSEWDHPNGNVYTVQLYTNLDSTREDYPPTVVYKDQAGKVWSTTVRDWNKGTRKRRS